MSKSVLIPSFLETSTSNYFSKLLHYTEPPESFCWGCLSYCDTLDLLWLLFCLLHYSFYAHCSWFRPNGTKAHSLFFFFIFPMAPLVVIFSCLNLCEWFQFCLTAFLRHKKHPDMYGRLTSHLSLQVSYHQCKECKVWFTSMSPFIIPAFSFLATPGPVMIKTPHRTAISWWYLEAPAILQVCHCCPLPPFAGQRMRRFILRQGTRGEGTAGAQPTAATALCPFLLSANILMVFLSFPMSASYGNCLPLVHTFAWLA